MKGLTPLKRYILERCCTGSLSGEWEYMSDAESKACDELLEEGRVIAVRRGYYARFPAITPAGKEALHIDTLLRTTFLTT